MSNAIDEFRRAMENAGIRSPDNIIADGEIHRFGTNGKASDTAGYYLLHADRFPAGMFGDWRQDISGTWADGSTAEMTDEEAAFAKARSDVLREQRRKERTSRQNESAQVAAQEWDRGYPCEYHPYLAAKGIAPHGAKVDTQGRLIIPMRNAKGELRNLERIGADGSKKGLYGGERSGLFFTIGNADDTKPLCIAEGFSTSASIHEATGLPVLVAFNAGNLPNCAAHVGTGRQTVVCGDADGIGKVKAEETARSLGAVAVYPPDEGMDFNDLFMRDGAEAVKTIIDGALADDWPPPFFALGATEAEAMEAKLAPKCIVERYLYADVGVLAAAGGTGKTTAMLYESACISLGLPVWGLEVVSPGPTLFLTKEDRRERLLARLREILGAMGLKPEQRAKVYRDVGILDVTGSDMRMLLVRDRNIERTAVAEKIVARYRDTGLAQIIIDPTVSFGASESLVNDNEQQLVEVARYIVGELECCLRYVHHTGQAAARAGTMDQYASRGGTALPDGCRLVSVMKPHDENSKTERPPYGCFSDSESSLTLLGRPKVSYAEPNQPLIWIKRTGFAYEYFMQERQSVEERQSANMDQLVRFVESRLKRDPPERFNSKSLDTQFEILGMTRGELRAARELLLSNGVLEEILFEHRPGSRGRKSYFLSPVKGAVQIRTN